MANKINNSRPKAKAHTTKPTNVTGRLLCMLLVFVILLSYVGPVSYTHLTITRGDFAIFLSKTFELKEASKIAFGYVDVDQNSYYHQYIINCTGNGIFDNSNTFFPDSPKMCIRDRI